MNLTLKDIPRLNLSKEDISKINLNLILLSQLSTLQYNLIRDIEAIYKRAGIYKMEIKHFHEQIKKLILRNGDTKCWSKMTEEQVEVMCRDADHLEELIMAWANNTMEEYFEKKMIKNE